MKSDAVRGILLHRMRKSGRYSGEDSPDRPMLAMSHALASFARQGFRSCAGSPRWLAIYSDNLGGEKFRKMGPTWLFMNHRLTCGWI